jgi:hypothetical protein
MSRRNTAGVYSVLLVVMCAFEQNEVGYISEIMCDGVDKGFNHYVLLLTYDFLKRVVQFLASAWLLCD